MPGRLGQFSQQFLGILTGGFPLPPSILVNSRFSLLLQQQHASDRSAIGNILFNKIMRGAGRRHRRGCVMQITCRFSPLLHLLADHHGFAANICVDLIEYQNRDAILRR